MPRFPRFFHVLFYFEYNGVFRGGEPMIKNYGFFLMLIWLTATGSPALAAKEAAEGGPDVQAQEKARKHIRDVIISTADLERRWKEAKEKFKAEMGEQVNVLEAALDERQMALDYGDKKTRDEITENIEDLSRAKADLEGELTELTAASSLDLSQVKGNIENKINDWKD